MATIDDLLSPAFVEGIRSLTLIELRARRDQCQNIADQLSYLRRQVQGRLDIVHAELERRAGGEPGDLGDLVELLKQGRILADKGRDSGTGRLAAKLEFVDEDGWITREMHEIVAPGKLSSLPELDEDEVTRIGEQLAALERKVSARRHLLHARTDELQGEMVRRYKSGEARVESLLQ